MLEVQLRERSKQLNIWGGLVDYLGLRFSKEALRLVEAIKGGKGIFERERDSSKEKVLKQSKNLLRDRLK